MKPSQTPITDSQARVVQARLTPKRRYRCCADAVFCHSANERSLPARAYHLQEQAAAQRALEEVQRAKVHARVLVVSTAQLHGAPERERERFHACAFVVAAAFPAEEARARAASRRANQASHTHARTRAVSLALARDAIDIHVILSIHLSVCLSVCLSIHLSPTQVFFVRVYTYARFFVRVCVS